MDATAPAPIDTAALLPDLWYYAMPGRNLARGRMLAKTLASQPLLFARTREGAVFALLDICPHRGIPLHHGAFDGAEVECCYHGWRFDQTGRCTAIPSLVEGQDFDIARIKVRRFPCREVQGNIWVFLGRDESVAPPVPELPEIGERAAQIIERVDFPCHVDHAVVGLMDPAHGPFVHTSWWWRSRKSIHEKTKNFAASEIGFRMTRHEPSSNSLAYRILGGGISTEISFRLPGIRIEHIKAGRYTLVGLTAVTPIDDTRSELHHVIYWTAPWLTALKPLLRPFARAFLNQDREIVVKQQEGLKHKPPLMLINDSDMPAKWYYRLKREWLNARQENRAFENPVRDAVLRWRS